MRREELMARTLNVKVDRVRRAVREEEGRTVIRPLESRESERGERNR